MSRESVTYRLGVSGDQEIRATLAAIGESGDSSAKRIARSFERDMRTVEATADRAKRRFEALQALGGSAVQRRIAESTGLAQSEFGNTKSAEASLQAFVREQDALARSRERLIAQADPLFAAQQRYNSTMAEAMRLDRAGALAKGDLAKVQARASAELGTLAGAQAGIARTSGAMTSGIQQAGFQVSDFAVQVGGGTSAIRAASQQAPQLVQAMALMGLGTKNSTSKFGKFTAFLAGPWGAAITVGVSVLGLFASKMLEGDGASEKLSESLDFQRMTHNELTKAIDEQVKAAEGAIAVSAASEKQALAEAEANLKNAIGVRELLKARLAATEAARSSSALAGGDAATRGTAAAGAADARSRLADNRGEIAGLERLVQANRFKVAESVAEAMLDPTTKVRRQYDLDKAELQKTAREERWSQAKTTNELAKLGKQRDAETKSIQDQQRARDKEAKGSKAPGLAETTSAGLLAGAARYIGLNENRASDNASLQTFFRKAGITIDPKMTAWCAAFVNAVLAADGLPGTSSLAARSFLDYGKETDAPRKGDIVILKRDAAGPASGHVGFFDGFDAKGNPILVSGNAGGAKAVTRQSFRKQDVLGYRRVGSPGEMILDRAKQEAQQQGQNEAAVRQLMEAADPFLVIANKLKDDLAEIDRLAGVSPALGGIGSEQAEILRGDARQRARKGELELKMGAIAPQIDYATKYLDEADEKAAEAKADYAKRLGAAQADQAGALAFQQLELDLIGASVAERERAIQQFEYIESLKRDGLELSDEEVQKLIDGNAEWFRRRGLIDDANEMLDRQRELGEGIVDTLLDPSGWDNWGEMGKKVINMLIQELMLLAVINPLKNQLFDTDYDTIGQSGAGILGFIKGIFKGGKAGGSEYTEGGFFEVGEFGKELVRLPGGSQVVNANRTRGMERGGGGGRTLNFDLRGAVVTEDLLRQMQTMADRAAEDGAMRGANKGVEQMIDLNKRTFGGALAPM